MPKICQSQNFCHKTFRYTVAIRLFPPYCTLCYANSLSNGLILYLLVESSTVCKQYWHHCFANCDGRRIPRIYYNTFPRCLPTHWLHPPDASRHWHTINQQYCWYLQRRITSLDVKYTQTLADHSCIAGVIASLLRGG